MAYRPLKKRKVRKIMLQVIYQWHITGQALQELVEQHGEVSQTIWPLFEHDMQHFIQHKSEINGYLDQAIDRDKHKISAIEWSILMLGCHELMCFSDQKDQFPQIITESMLLANDFVVPSSIKYINAVLDHVAHQIKKQHHG